MKPKELSSKINLIIDILDKIFVKADSYQMISSKYDDFNEQLDIHVRYEFPNNDEIEPGMHVETFIVGIPDYILNSKVLNTDIKNFIEIMTEIIDNEMIKI